jgi:hypothetical protein
MADKLQMNCTGLTTQSIERKAQYEAQAGGMNQDVYTLTYAQLRCENLALRMVVA